MGGTQSLHTNAFDEAFGLPTERSATIALRTQQILATESGVTDTADPLAGSFYVEALTDEVERLALELIDRVEEMGGAVAAIEDGFMQRQIDESAYMEARRIEDGSSVVVGVNRFVDAEPSTGTACTRSIRGSRPTRSPGWPAVRERARPVGC